MIGVGEKHVYKLSSLSTKLMMSIHNCGRPEVCVVSGCTGR
jgi:ATP-dependent Clp protease adapter protein ClpS